MRKYLRRHRWHFLMLSCVPLCLSPASVPAELTPGTRLTKANCQEAKDLLPEQVTDKFCNGQYEAEIIEVKDEAFQYSKKFKEGSEANEGKYYVTDDGFMYETATKMWPHFWYDYPFPKLDERDLCNKCVKSVGQQSTLG